jgi:phosphoribosylamine--glycine ligase / phosphoribosylformylglycinamidine cyclo-ligase
MLLPKKDIVPGDVLLGLSSSGLHSNGFSLVRKIVEISGLLYSSPCPWDADMTLGRALLEPTRIYVKQIIPAVHAGLLKGMSHITGGGFIENIPRILPTGLGCDIDLTAWSLPPVFKFLAKEGRVQPLEMCRTFNNGIGMVIVVGRDQVDSARKVLQDAGEAKVYEIGQVTSTGRVVMTNLHAWNFE